MKKTIAFVYLFFIVLLNGFAFNLRLIPEVDTTTIKNEMKAALKMLNDGKYESMSLNKSGTYATFLQTINDSEYYISVNLEEYTSKRIKEAIIATTLHFATDTEKYYRYFIEAFTISYSEKPFYRENAGKQYAIWRNAVTEFNVIHDTEKNWVVLIQIVRS